jgi:hypothetical protein
MRLDNEHTDWTLQPRTTDLSLDSKLNPFRMRAVTQVKTAQFP